MKDRKYISIILTLFVLTTGCIGTLLIYFNNFSSLSVNVEDEYSIPNNLELANDNNLPALSYSSINRNTTTIYRLFQSINITINIFDFILLDFNYTKIQIDFSNSSTNIYNMTPGGTNEYYYEYKPLYNDPLGFQNVSFLIYNSTNRLLNAHTTYTNFTTLSNYLLTTNSSEYYIGDDMYAELVVHDTESYQFGWNLTIVDSTIESTQQNIFNIGDDLVQFTYQITNETFNDYVDQMFYVKLNMTNKTSGRIAAAYFPFKVLNSEPTIETSSIIFTPTQVFRAEDCEITFNVSDIEDHAQDLDVSMTLEDAEGNLVATISIDYVTDNNFSKVFSVSAAKPIGKYRITINAEDQDGGVSSYITSLTIKNNKPEIHNYKINGQSMNEPVSVLYGNDLIFTFNVSDVEKVAYITIALIDENNEWYNITRAYTGTNMQISIRTIELVTGVWYVYLFVIDSDGAVSSLTSDYDMAPQSIRIIPDVLSGFLPWTLFIIGAILGIFVGVGLSYRHFKLKSVETQAPPQKEKSSVKKQKKKESTEKVIEKTSEEVEVEQQPEEETSPKRKIKRKL